MDEIIIKVKDVNLQINNENILNNINIDIIKGKIYGFVGRNGSGKSMLFKCICGLVKATKGEISVSGKKIGCDIDFPEDIGILIENPGFLPNINGFKNLKLLSDINGKIKDDSIKEYIKLVGLDSNNKKPVKKYSLGMKQRLGIAQAFMENQDIIILDEPMNALDKEGVHLIRNLIKSLKKEGKTILLASHNEEDIKELCDVTFQLDGGKIFQ